MRPHEFIDKVAGAGLARRTTVWYSWFLAGQAVLNNISGCLVECGVFAGTNSAAMWRGAVDHGVKKLLCMFDSFEGIPPAGPKDDEQWQAKKPYGAKCSLENVKENMKKWGVKEAGLVYFEGWFEETIPLLQTMLDFPLSKISVLRLDGDLYESTKSCIPLFDFVNPGGYVIIDDYALKGCRTAINEFFENRNDQPIWHTIPDSGGVVWGRKE